MIPNCSHVKFENLQQRLDFTLRKDFSKNKISSTLPIVLREYSLKSRKINQITSYINYQLGKNQTTKILVVIYYYHW